MAEGELVMFRSYSKEGKLASDSFYFRLNMIN